MKSLTMKRICLFIYLWSDAVASKSASGNRGVSQHPALRQFFRHLYIHVQTYMQEKELAKCNLDSHRHLGLMNCFIMFYLRKFT